MTTKDIREFLESFTADELKDRGILFGPKNLLMGHGVRALLTLMNEQGVRRVESPAHDWFLDGQGEFKNNKSDERKTGNIADLQKLGSVFNYMNTAINPHFGRANEEDGVVVEIEEAVELKFGLERDMQAALRRNIEQLEQGLKVIDGGSERTVEAGRIDITAQDNDDKLVVIELKAGMAGLDSITQILAYMGSLLSEAQGPVRGILVAGDFHHKVLLAAQAVPNLQLKRYSFSFSFRDC
ncbi:MAG: DUF91 domain-containing protein [Chloroflexi bacterium]|nr:DUF91 domain-containing protein [Chloroflexota bacterium]